MADFLQVWFFHIYLSMLVLHVDLASEELEDGAVAYLAYLPVGRVEQAVGAPAPVRAEDQPPVEGEDVAGGELPAAEVDGLSPDACDVELATHIVVVDGLRFHGYKGTREGAGIKIRNPPPGVGGGFEEGAVALIGATTCARVAKLGCRRRWGRAGSWRRAYSRR